MAFEPDPEPADAGLSRRGLMLRGVGTVAGVAGVVGVATEVTGITDSTPISGGGGDRRDTREAPVVVRAVLSDRFVRERSVTLSDHQVDSMPAGREIWIVFRYGYRLHDHDLEMETTVDVRAPDGDRVASETVEETDSHEAYSGVVYFNQGALFDTRGWEPGEYTAALTVRDEVTDEASPTEEITFELT